MKKLEILLKDGKKLYVDPENSRDDYIKIIEISSYFRRQNQYLSTYFNPNSDSKQLGEGIRVEMKNDDYHSMAFHKEDVSEVIDRLKKHYDSLCGEKDTEERINEYYRYNNQF